MTLWSKIQGHSDLIFIFNTPSCPTTKYEGTRPYDKKVLSLSNLIFDLVVKGQGLNDQMLTRDTLPCPYTYTYNI